jgi:Septum formation
MTAGMGRLVATSALAVAVMGGAAACGGGSSSKPGALPTPPQSKAPASSRTHRVRVVGQCHLASQRVLTSPAIDRSPAVDRSKPVPCVRPHNVEVAGLHPVFGKVTHAVLENYQTDCFGDLDSYLHLQGDEVLRLVAVPDAATTATGRQVVRCDIVTLTNSNSTRNAAVTTGSVKQQAASGDTTAWAVCTDQVPKGDVVQYADCARPHLRESLPHLESLSLPGARFPKPSDRTRRGAALCHKAIAGRPDAARLAVFGFWESRQQWVAQQSPPTLLGDCWFFRRDGHDLPAIH